MSAGALLLALGGLALAGEASAQASASAIGEAVAAPRVMAARPRGENTFQPKTQSYPKGIDPTACVATRLEAGKK